MPLSRSRPEFFLDRSVARRVVAAALREAGWSVRTHIEVYGDRDEAVEDVEWLELCGTEGWAVLTMDRRLRYRPSEIAAIRRHRVRGFALASGNLQALDQARRLLANEAEIFDLCDDPGPFVYAVYADGVERIFPS
jgi:hypothetical protein